jgi:uncharacterized protein
MLCPIDQTELRMTERQGVEIDYCPKCRGVWLDRGELDKIIEWQAAGGRPTLTPPSTPHRPVDQRHEVGRSAPAPSTPRDDIPRRRDGDDDDDDDYRDRDYDRYNRRRRRRDWLEDLFDFD